MTLLFVFVGMQEPGSKQMDPSVPSTAIMLCINLHLDLGMLWGTSLLLSCFPNLESS